jgi:hypothetical protein
MPRRLEEPAWFGNHQLPIWKSSVKNWQLASSVPVPHSFVNWMWIDFEFMVGPIWSMLNDGDKGAILQRDRKTYGIAPHLPCGVVTPDALRKLADVAEKYDVPLIKVTSAARIALLGVTEEQVDAIWSDLDMDPGSVVGICVRSIKACPGTSFCKRGQQDSLKAGLELDEKFHGIQDQLLRYRSIAKGNFHSEICFGIGPQPAEDVTISAWNLDRIVPPAKETSPARAGNQRK